MKMLPMLTIALGAVGMAAGLANAQLLSNGDFEAPLALQGWTLDETVTGMPGVPVNSAQIQDFANQPGAVAGETGLWLRAFVGNVGDLSNEATNAVLSQVVPGAPGDEYTFSGWSRWEPNYSGGVTTLHEDSPSGAVASPTSSTFELAFLDAGSSVIGTPTTLDLRTEQMNDNMWRQHTLTDTAPAGTAAVRVTAAAHDMVFNVDPGQSGFYDNFSLTSDGAPGAEQLDNADLNAPLITPGWTVVESPAGADTLQFAGFANNTPGGGSGVWLRPFVTTVPEGDATLTQTVPGAPGVPYEFSAWSRWEANYSGGQTGSPTQTLLELAFLDGSGTEIGAPLTLDLRDEQMNVNTWRQHTLAGVAPEGTASVRVSAMALDMFATEGGQSAFFDDFNLKVVPEPGSFALGLIGLLGVGWAARRAS